MAEEFIEPLVGTPMAGKEFLDIARGVRVGSPYRKQAMLNAVGAIDRRELGRDLAMGALNAIELTLLTQNVHPRSVTFVEISVRVGDGNLDTRSLEDWQHLFNRRIGRPGHLIAHADFQVEVLLGAGHESAIDTIIHQHPMFDVGVAL